MEFLTRNDYNVKKDWKAVSRRKILQEHKDKLFLHYYGVNLSTYRPKYKYAMSYKDENGVDIANDVSEIYPVSLEEERAHINKTASNLQFLREVKDNFEYCRTRCKVLDSRIRVLDAYSREHQMCLTDCVNVRTELFGPDLPAGSKKNFIWIA